MNSNRLCSLFVALLLSLMQTTSNVQSVIYKSSPSLSMPNPERGLYHSIEVFASQSPYNALNEASLTNYRLNENITLILRLFYLDSFKTSAITQDFLDNIKADFDTIRRAGIKCILRFAYSNNPDSNPLDASKSLMKQHISKLTPILASNSDIIAVVQSGFIGAYGEAYYTSFFGSPPLSPTNLADRKEIYEDLLNAITPDVMIQVRTPKYKQLMWQSTALTSSQAFSDSSVARVGHHNDCFLASVSDLGTYTNKTDEYPYLAQETLYTPMGGETCQIDKKRCNCPTALLEMQMFHWSYLNIDYNPDVLNVFKSEGCFADIKNKLGYLLVLTSANFPSTVSLSNPKFMFTINLSNIGFASMFNKRTVYLVVKSSTITESIPLKTDPRLWAAGKAQTVIESVTLPKTVIKGTYALYLHLPDKKLPNRPEYSIRFANDISQWDSKTGYNNLLVSIRVQ